MAFNYTSKVARIQIDNSTNVPYNPSPSLQNNTFLYGNRRDPLNINFKASSISGSPQLSLSDNSVTLKTGLIVTGAGIPNDTIITNVSGLNITISNAATATGTSVNFLASENSLPVPIPSSGYPKYDYYSTYKLNDNLVTDPSSLLLWFKNCGYDVAYGYSGSYNISGVLAVRYSLVNNNIDLYFNNQAYNIQNIANTNVSGEFNIPSTDIHGSIVAIQTGVYDINSQRTLNGDSVIATNTINNLVGALSINTGSAIKGINLPNGTTVTGVLSDTSITISNNALTTATGIEYIITDTENVMADTKITLNSSSYKLIVVDQNIVLNYTKQSNDPDITKTEPFIMNLWQASKVTQRLNELNPNATVGAPAIYFAILPNKANTNYFSPQDSNFELNVVPNSVNNIDTSQITLILNTPFDFQSFIPSLSFGNTTIIQNNTGASGTIFQSITNNNTLSIELHDVNGTFNTTDTLSLSLDSSITLMKLQNTYFSNNQLSLRTMPLIYEVSNNADITNKYAVLFDYVVSLNDPSTANYGQGNCSIVFGNQSIRPNVATSKLPTAINNQYYRPFYINFVNRPGVIPRTIAQSICALSTIMASNIYPFNPMNDIYIGGFDNSPYPQDWVDMSVGGVGDQLINLGWNVIATNSNNQQYLFLGRSGQTTINNVPDNEFYPSYVEDTKDYIRKAEIFICRNNGVGQVRQTDTTLQKINLDIVSLMNRMGENGDQILSNVAKNITLIKVSRNPINPLGISIYNPIQQTPAFLNAYATITNYSIEFTL